MRTTDISGTRWRTVRYDKRTRISTQEMTALVQLYPQYALWLASGEIIPEKGQTSPAYDAQHQPNVLH
ncbi:DNA-binding protein [Metapseudomonas otitidis]|uniref:DNA-binding protein n=1 Tax=Metapseudomonas otitidis TaxID=319939 RepID=UPI00366BB0EA